MANTYTQLYFHLVFAVQGRQHLIAEHFRERLQQYITGVVQKQGNKLMAIYCMPDHVHLLVSMKPDIALSDLVRDIKSNSSSFIKEHFVKTFSWQSGFGAFTYAKSQMNDVINYIVNQPVHHQKKTFQQEYIEFLNRFEIAYDDKYLFEFYG